MKDIGIGLLIVGGAILGFFAFVGIDTGIEGFRTTNFAGLFVGTALMICGSVFTAVGVLSAQITYLHEQSKRSKEAKPLPKKNVDRRPVAVRMPEKKPEELEVTEYKGVTINKRHNGHYIGDKWFAGLKQAQAFVDEGKHEVA